jgi:hypothetical protein
MISILTKVSLYEGVIAERMPPQKRLIGGLIRIGDKLLMSRDKEIYSTAHNPAGAEARLHFEHS